MEDRDTKVGPALKDFTVRNRATGGISEMQDIRKSAAQRRKSSLWVKIATKKIIKVAFKSKETKKKKKVKKLHLEG